MSKLPSRKTCRAFYTYLFLLRLNYLHFKSAGAKIVCRIINYNSIFQTCPVLSTCCSVVPKGECQSTNLKFYKKISRHYWEYWKFKAWKCCCIWGSSGFNVKTCTLSVQLLFIYNQLILIKLCWISVVVLIKYK